MKTSETLIERLISQVWLSCSFAFWCKLLVNSRPTASCLGLSLFFLCCVAVSFRICRRNIFQRKLILKNARSFIEALQLFRNYMNIAWEYWWKSTKKLSILTVLTDLCKSWHTVLANPDKPLQVFTNPYRSLQISEISSILRNPERSLQILCKTFIYTYKSLRILTKSCQIHAYSFSCAYSARIC